jgi:hypothetical protein
MTRERQTAILLSAMALLALVAAYAWPDPDFTSMDPMKRCAYSSWNKNNGGSRYDCERLVAQRAMDSFGSR